MMPELVSGDQGSSPSSDANQLCDLGEDTPLSGPGFLVRVVGPEWEKRNQPFKVTFYPSFSELPQLRAQLPLHKTQAPPCTFLTLLPAASLGGTGLWASSCRM